jgi:hypothetical protein
MAKFTEEDKKELLDWAAANTLECSSNFPWMTYEQGIQHAFDVTDGKLSVQDIKGGE